MGGPLGLCRWMDGPLGLFLFFLLPLFTVCFPGIALNSTYRTAGHERALPAQVPSSHRRRRTSCSFFFLIAARYGIFFFFFFGGQPAQGMTERPINGQKAGRLHGALCSLASVAELVKGSGAQRKQMLATPDVTGERGGQLIWDL